MESVMKMLCRLALIMSVLLTGLALAMVGAKNPWLVIVCLIATAIVAAKKGYIRLTTLGSARWADGDDLRQAGMLDAKTGLILGRISDTRPRVGPALKALFNPRVASDLAVEQFLALFRKKQPEVLVRLSKAVHTAVFAPTGVGKGVSCVIPFLLTSKEPCFVLDVKDGELARITAEARRRMGRKVYIIDPYHCVTNTPATLNPVQFIDKNSPYALDDSREIAAEIVERKQQMGDGVHFLDNAEAAIAAVTATVVEYGEEHQKSLQAVCDIVSSPHRWGKAVQLMVGSPAQEGMLARLGGNLMHLKDRELASTMTTIARFLRFLSTPAIAASTRKSSFDPREILDGNTDVYCVLPADRVATLSPLLRVWTGTFLRTALRGKGDSTIHFVCDEAGSSLGKMDQLATALTVGRSAGIRLQLYYQDLGQLKKCWPEGADQTLLANVNAVFFGVNDQQTAEHVSARLGDETVVVDSGGTSDGMSRQEPNGTSPGSTTYSWNRSSNWGQQARRLLKPEEVATLPARVAITFTPGVPPICTNLIRYYEEPNLDQPPGIFQQAMKWIKTWAECVALLLTAIMGLVVITHLK
jgi:type IV secretion system protein VirD4